MKSNKNEIESVFNDANCDRNFLFSSRRSRSDAADVRHDNDQQIGTAANAIEAIPQRLIVSKRTRGVNLEEPRTFPSL